MCAPGFWFHPPEKKKLLSLFLNPLGYLYGRVTARRVAQPSRMLANCPVICVGNLNVGGTGKTPTVIAIAQICQQIGAQVCIVTCGYRGTLKGAIKVESSNHRAHDIGDESLLLASFATTIMAKDRVEGVYMAQKFDPDVILLDDGFQDPSIYKNLSIIVVDANVGFGNGRCLPAGPLREPVAQGLKRANAVLSIGKKAAQSYFHEIWSTEITVKHFEAILKPLKTGLSWSKGKYVAFAGIGHPEKFFTTLRDLGASLIHCEALGDHECFTYPLLRRLKLLADVHDAQLVTTEKDATRLPDSFRKEVLVLPVRLLFDQTDDFRLLIKRALVQG